MVKQIRSLDSDMQTLVYENYNKFISATGERASHSVYVWWKFCASGNIHLSVRFFFPRHYKKDEERLQKDGGRDGLPVRQHGSDHRVQRQHQWNSSRPARADYKALR